MRIENAERIIVALDCDGAQARSLAEQLSNQAHWLKVGMTLYYAEGPGIVRELKELGFKVFVDLKLHDIPHQVRGAAQTIVEAGADMLTVHASGGSEMMKAAYGGVQRGVDRLRLEVEAVTPPVLLAITVLTSMDQNALSSIGVDREVAQQVQELARMAMGAGLDGVVASPQEASLLRGLLGEAATIVTPGIRPAARSAVHDPGQGDDQSRISTPKAAVIAGASYVVIGRPITAALDPLSAFTDIVRSMD